MTDFRKVTDRLSVSGQITPDEAAEAARQGFVLVINNRPDGEVAGQPSSAEVEQAVRAAGAEYRHIPVVGMPTAEQGRAQAEAVAAAAGPVLAFCRSGNRSTLAWALGEATRGRDRAELARLVAAAGYNPAPLLGG